MLSTGCVLEVRRQTARHVHRMTALELTIRKYAEQPDKSVMRPALGLSFDSLGEAYDFYNLYSWEIGFGIGYGKSRLNAQRTKTMQEIVCGCSGKTEAENSRSCRCECPVLIRLLRASDNSWYITEHRENHNHSLSLTMGEKVHCPSHKHIDVYTKDLIRQLRENNVNLGKVYNIIGSFFGSVEKVPFTKRTLRNIRGKINREQADDDVQKTLESDLKNCDVFFICWVSGLLKFDLTSVVLLLLHVSQPWFFDWMDYGTYNVEQHTVPRISLYTAEICTRLIYVTREYPDIFPTKPHDEFDHLDEDWHDVVGEPGGILQHEGQREALRAAEALIAAIQQDCTTPEGRRGKQGAGGDTDTNTLNDKGKGVADESSDSSSSDSDDERVDPSIRLARPILRADRRGESIDAPPTSVRIPGVVGGNRVTGPRSLNRFRQRLLVGSNNTRGAAASNASALVVNPDRHALLRSRGEHLRAELSEIEAQAKSDLE
ncbi:uncharacterized protein LOC119341476 isoform X2 [Triticum dicoccoides]|nr:uncharacterized protein LOC119341476 isoform X2 [Triticum dicoccoides]XP_037469247.1 uncharacterized protein LOC119341476 isoform X2 [Triticum dicoccoides]